MTFFLALRNLFLQRKRYGVISLAVVIGFALITVISGITNGALNTVKFKAARYFAGHISVTGFSPDRGKRISDPDRLVTLLQGSLDEIRSVSKRTVYYRQDATLFFGGESIRQRRLVGIEFRTEADELRGMDFDSGGIDSMLGADGEMGILISRIAADLLSARVGDDVQLYLTTDSGQYNTATLVVNGIFEEPSLFGFAAYLRNQDLNRLMGRESGAATDIAVYARNGINLDRLGLNVRATLADVAAVMPVLTSKADRGDALSEGFTEETLAVMTLNAHLAQITDILDAFTAISYFVLFVFVVIVMVGILNTYRVIVYERTKEIGTMRALGMGRGTVIGLFITEAALLAGSASIMGLLCGVGILRIIGLIDFSAIAAAGMFTEGGRFSFFVEPKSTSLNFLAMIIAVMLAAIGPARKAGSIRPVDAMRMNG
jgi:putative ABC transport system permease protein